MKDNQDTYNAKALNAWEEWKRICTVDGCSPSARAILRDGEIGKAFQGKLKALGAEVAYRKEECVHFFDAYCLGATNMEGSVRLDAPKHYKDRVWNIAEQSADPPLKVIRGKLIGPRSYLNGIVEAFLKQEVSGKLVHASDGKRKWLQFPSANEPLPNPEDSNITLEDCLEAPEADFVEKEDLNRLAVILQTLGEEYEALAFLAIILKLKPDRPEIRNVFHGKRVATSTWYDWYGAFLDKLKANREIREIFVGNDPRQLAFAIRKILCRRLENKYPALAELFESTGE